MSTSYGGTPPGITDTHYGGSDIGILGSEVPTEGLDGPSYLAGGNPAALLRGPITRWPAGVLVVREDGTFDYTGPSDYALYQLYEDGPASTSDIGYGAGIGRIELGMDVGGSRAGAVTLDDVVAAGALGGGGASGVSGNVQLDEVAAAGSLTGGSASNLGGSVQLDDVVAAGELQGVNVSEIGGNVTLGDVVASGTLIGDVSNEPLPQGQRVVHADRQTPFKFKRGLDVTEQDVLTFEFTRVLDGETVVSAAPTSEARVGTDAEAATLLLGQHQVHGTQVRMRINGVGRVPGVIYLVRCPTTLSSGRVVTPAAFVRVVRRA